MKKNHTSVGLIGLGMLSAAMGQEPVPAVESPAAVPSDAPAATVLDAARVRQAAAANAALELADRMAFVVDRTSADAAAAAIAPMVPLLLEQGGEETFWTRMYMAYTGCYGSDALRRVLAPLLPPADTAQNPGFAEAMALMQAVLQTLEDITATLDAVQDKLSAETAAEALQLFAEHIDQCMQKSNGVSKVKGNRIDLIIYFYSEEYRRTSALFSAWGALQNRSVDYYGSEHLAEAMECLSATMENLDQPADPYAIGKMVQVCPRMEEQLRLWLNTAATVHDTAGADAAAPILRACADKLNDLAAPLGQGCEKELGHVSPMFLFLSYACDRIVHRFARSGYFGSAALQESLEQ